MAETPREPKLDPYVLIAQESVLDLAELICSNGRLEDGEYLIEIYPTTAPEVENGLAEAGLGQLAILGADKLEPNAVAGAVELYAESNVFQMCVIDMINNKNPEGEIPVENAKSRTAFVGFVFPYTGVDENNDTFLKVHHIVVAADSTDEPPSISSWLDIQILGEASSRCEITHNSILMTAEQSLAFVALAKTFYEQSVDRNA